MAGYHDSADVTESNSISREPSFFERSEEGDEAKGDLARAQAPDDRSIISRSTSVCKSSEEDLCYKCDPCSTAGDEAEVTGYCVNCEEYLCSDCYKDHPRNKASRNHRLLDKDSMPTKETIYCDPCGLEQVQEEAHGYCKECGEYLCASCSKSHSRNKASRKHTLLDKDSMPKSVRSMTSGLRGMTSSFARFGMRTEVNQNLLGMNILTNDQGIVVRTVGNTPNSMGGFLIRKSYR